MGPDLLIVQHITVSLAPKPINFIGIFQKVPTTRTVSIAGALLVKRPGMMPIAYDNRRDLRAQVA